jgi:hypothetical protein
MKKIYCGYCRYYDYDRWDMKVHYKCSSNPKHEDGVIYPRTICSDCLAKNNNNDCKEFEPNLLTLIYHYWGGKKITGKEEVKGSWKKIKNYFRKKNDETKTTKPNA